MKSVWQEFSSFAHFPQLNKDIKTDVLIIGGGITGLLTARFLHQNGVNYTLVEKGKICEGVTQNTTAKITFQHGLIYDKILKSEGVETAQKYLLSNKLAFEKYSEMCESVDCDFEVKDNYVYSLDDREKLENEIKALQKIGYKAELSESVPLPLSTVGAVRFPNQAQFNPLKFLSAISKDLNVYENTFVREMVENTAVTDHGKIYADRVIVTTHFPFINKHGSYFLKLYQHRSYVIALENTTDVGGMYVDEKQKGLSFRNYNGLLFLGGGDHRTGKKGGNWAELRSFAKENYPQAKEKFFWATQDCMSLDSIPYIGQYSKSTPDLYVASGFNKWGMTGAMVSAMLLTDAMLGKQDDYADIYDPSRSILKPQLFVNGFETAVNFLTPTVRRCPHLGCALKWNKAEHSWDCPCHGSRFDEAGKVLDNPANGNLDI
ncbi:MAG: FAD-dependent oxidoreductase [Clostridia bacterium]|nr:FAD-dependent oxidoreductase [Clostridia bacterium]